MAHYSDYTGMPGFWAKRSDQPEPEFISVTDGDIEKWKEDWAAREGVDWVGDDPNDFYTEYDPSKPYTEEGADVVEDTYFDVLLKDIETEYGAQRGSVEAGYETYMRQLKTQGKLFNEALSKDYGKALESLNISTQARGVQDSGIRERQTVDITAEKEFVEKERATYESQKGFLASEERRERLESIGRQEKRSRAGLRSAAIESPYAGYSLI